MAQAELRASRLIPPGARETFIPYETGRVRLLESEGAQGLSGPPLVLIHGGGTDNGAISWYRVFQALGRQYPIMALDLPGFGATEGIEPLGGPRAMADFTVAVMERAGIDSAVVFGVSMGGDVALNIALAHPRFVRGLVLIGPGGLVPIIKTRRLHTAAWLGTRLPDWLLLPLARLANRFVKSALKAMVHDAATLPAQVVAEFVREAQRPGAGMGYGRYNQATVGRHGMLNNLLPVVAGIKAPTLFFHGQNDPMVDPAGSIQGARLMPHARLVMPQHCGHWAQLEQHERFTGEVEAFLRDIL